MTVKRDQVQRAQLLFNGISLQPSIQKLANQVPNAVNANFSVVDGITRRPGSWIQQHVHEGLLPAANNRLHEIIRDQNERYIVVHNRTAIGAVLRVLELSSNLWSDITISPVAQAYINSAGPDEFRMRTLLDTTLIVNTSTRTHGTDRKGVISNISIENPTKITSIAHGFTAGNGTISAIVSATQNDPAKITSATHGLTTGQRVTITNSNSIPPVDGTWNVTVLDANTFYIQTRVLTSGTTGVWTRGETITISGSDSIPSLDGQSYPVTVIDADTFTIPVEVTGGSSAGPSHAITAISTGLPATVTTTVPHGLLTGQVIRVTSQTTSPGMNNQIFSVLVTGANTFEINILITVASTSGSWTLFNGEPGAAEATWSHGSIDNAKMPMQLTRQNTSTTGTLTANTATNPTVITSASHGLVTGQTVHITNSNSTPSIDGAYPVIVLSTNTFSIPVNVSVAGISGNWVAAAYFTLDSINWDDRKSGTALTNPLPKLWLTGGKIFDLRYWRGRLTIVSNQGGIISQAQNLFAYWIEDVNAIGDADPIPFTISSDTNIDANFAVPLQESLMIFAKAGKQFLLNTSYNALSLSTLRCDPVTSYRTLNAEPVVMDPAVYFGVNVGGNVHLFEYFYDEVSAPNTAEDVSLHVNELIPLLVNVPEQYGPYFAETSTLRKVAVCPEEGFVFVLRRDKISNGEVFGTNIHVYRTRYVGTKKVQVAWTVWKIAGIRGIHDFVVIGIYLYVLVHCGTESPPDFFLLRINIPEETVQDSAPSPTT